MLTEINPGILEVHDHTLKVCFIVAVEKLSPLNYNLYACEGICLFVSCIEYFHIYTVL